ncbi:MAG: hypothetical protein WDN49_20970 [Acetobacteraceae bacterium]
MAGTNQAGALRSVALHRRSDGIADQKFAVGQSVPRQEDPKLLRGEGRYSDDLNLPGQLYGVMVRSRLAHGHIRGIDTAEALAMPGVAAIYTAEDLHEAGIGRMPAASHRNP